MSRKITGTTFAFVCFTLLCGLLALPAPAQECSISQVAGKYAAWTQGNVIGIGPRVSAAIFTLDPSGKVVNGKATSSLNGTVTPELFSGTYLVNPDCTGELNVVITDTSNPPNKLFTVTVAIYFDDGGREIRGIFTSAVTVPPPPPPVTNGTALPTAIVFEARKIGEQ